MTARNSVHACAACRAKTKRTPITQAQSAAEGLESEEVTCPLRCVLASPWELRGAFRVGCGDVPHCGLRRDAEQAHQVERVVDLERLIAARPPMATGRFFGGMDTFSRASGTPSSAVIPSPARKRIASRKP